MVDFNTTIPLIEPITSAIGEAFQLIQVMVGGIIGLYIIYGIVMWRNNRKHIKLLSEIRDQLVELNTRVSKLESKKRK